MWMIFARRNAWNQTWKKKHSRLFSLRTERRCLWNQFYLMFKYVLRSWCWERKNNAKLFVLSQFGFCHSSFWYAVESVWVDRFVVDVVVVGVFRCCGIGKYAKAICISKLHDKEANWRAKIETSTSEREREFECENSVHLENESEWWDEKKMHSFKSNLFKVARKLSLHKITLMSNVLAWQHTAVFSFHAFVLRLSLSLALSLSHNLACDSNFTLAVGALRWRRRQLRWLWLFAAAAAVTAAAVQRKFVIYFQW